SPTAAPVAAPRRARAPPFRDRRAPHGELGRGGHRRVGARFRALPRGNGARAPTERTRRAPPRRLHGRRTRAARRTLAARVRGARRPRRGRARGTTAAALSRPLEPSVRDAAAFRTSRHPETRQVEMSMANRLANETSPYLLQHANNPVDWYPWGEEALRRAREEDKPIFLSIGYAACHWCHVMERESFENPEIA